MNVLMVVAPAGFRDEELTGPRAELKIAGYGVTVASVHPGECRGVFGTRVVAELALSDVDTAKFDGVVFVGGPGARVFFDDPDALRIAHDLSRQHKVTAAICIAPVILARAGVLAGRRATASDAETEALVSGRALVRALGSVRDGPVVTANGPEQARRFGAMVVQALDEQLAARINQLAGTALARTR
jgi:protease I